MNCGCLEDMTTPAPRETVGDAVKLLHPCALHICYGNARAAEERARIVDYLRGVAAQYAKGDMLPQCDFTAEAYRDAADAVSRGRHVK